MCTYVTITRLHNNFKNLYSKLEDLNFSGEDQIIIFIFLSHLVEDADSLDMDERTLMVCTPQMLTKTTAQDYVSSLIRNRDSLPTYYHGDF